MDLTELGEVMGKIEVLEGRTFSPEQTKAWFEILSDHSQADALGAVIAFHSKPFKRPSYPGDIKAHILETEAVRLRRCGTLDANEAEWFNGPPTAVYPKLRRLISTGEWTPDDYRSYRRSRLTLEQYLEKQEALVG